MFRLIQLLITILVALSLIRSVVRAFQRLFGGEQTQTRVQPRAPQQSTEPGAHTTLQQDPVCGTYVSVDTSLKKLQGGRVIHFCSSECRDRYVA